MLGQGSVLGSVGDRVFVLVVLLVEAVHLLMMEKTVRPVEGNVEHKPRGNEEEEGADGGRQWGSEQRKHSKETKRRGEGRGGARERDEREQVI